MQMSFLKNRRWLPALALLGGLIFSAGAKPYGLNSRPQAGAFLNGAMPETAPAISGNWSAVVAFPNLLFTNSVGLTFVPESTISSNQLCVWEREGRIWTFENSSNAAQKKLVLDLQQSMPGLGRFRFAWRRVSSRFCDEPFHVCVITPGSSPAQSPARQRRGQIRRCRTLITTASNATLSMKTASRIPDSRTF